MDKRLLAITTALSLALLAGCGGSGGSKTTAKTPVTGGTSLTIQDFSYKPSPLMVAPGATISVNNLDGSAHTVTSDKDGAFKVNDITKGKAFTFTAPTAPGTYTYFCEYHGSMHGTLVVK